MGDDVQVAISGTENVASAVSYDVKHVDAVADGTQVVRLTFGLWELCVSVDFCIDQADEFLVEVRDAVVRAKRAQIEWETNTDPETGIVGEDENARQ